MVLFPYSITNIKTTLSIEEVKKDIEYLLYNEYEECISFTGKKKHHLIFKGWIRNSKFKLYRYKMGRNTFKITVVGKIQEDKSGALIKLRFRMLPISYIITFTTLYIITQPIKYTYISTGHFSLLPSILFLAMYTLMMLGFNYDLYMINKHLSKYFQGWLTSKST